jgi:hypothetical protein
LHPLHRVSGAVDVAPPGLTEDQPIELSRFRRVRIGHQMAVAVERCLDRGVAELRLDVVSSENSCGTVLSPARRLNGRGQPTGSPSHASDRHKCCASPAVARTRKATVKAHRAQLMHKIGAELLA